ncbi:MAG TPA: hypothetical protein VF110_03930, partial [Burkholderiales bacterium]
GPHPLAAAQAHARFMGSDGKGGYSISVLTPTADPGMGAKECASSLAVGLVRRYGLKREDVLARRPNDSTFVMLFAVKADPLLQLKAYLLSGSEGRCVEVHLSRNAVAKEDLAPWFRGFHNARIEIP